MNKHNKNFDIVFRPHPKEDRPGKLFDDYLMCT